MKNGTFFGGKGLVVLAVLGILMTGCSFKVTVPVLEDAVLPAMPLIFRGTEETWKDSTDDKLIIGPTSLGEICGFENLEQFQEAILAEAQENIAGLPLFLLDIIDITGVFLETMEFSASTGDFTSLRRIVMEVQGPDEKYVFIVKNTGDFGQTVNLAADPPLDLVKASGGNCLEPMFTVEGDLPEQDVIYDVLMRLKVKYRLRLF